ncbi:heme lyase NrfEFG subunit NrfF [Paraferrimonas sedimenticola]|uniref:Formate-dependent nitrite reductase complex subunit n=1 Tax=Paraferrimonas sedimenticola TaxID=375674 RepID=A0AA37W2E2_9GAMM|nr:heme lyase NrfEFG subunit NrfF [Paraferrimonas sedimenticola]GLP97707.1 cytochrome c biogenesis protein [Paraferrimonas sedimenticola]
MKKLAIAFVSALLVLGLTLTTANATPVDTYQFKTVEHQKRALKLAEELRCPQCQNQNLIDSNSPVAQDLRLEVYQMVDAGKTDAEIVEFMTSRYGDFVLYKPRWEPKTLVLWLGPIGLLLFGGAIAFTFIRRSRNAPKEEVAMTDEQRAELDALLNRDK